MEELSLYVTVLENEKAREVSHVETITYELMGFIFHFQLRNSGLLFLEVTCFVL